MTAVSPPATRRRIVPLRTLWFGIFGAPLAWALQLIAGYSLVAHNCFPKDVPLNAPAFGPARMTAVIVTAALVLVALGALAAAIHSWREMRHHHDAERGGVLEVTAGRARFMAFGGILLSGIFLFGLLMSAVPLLTSSLCMY